MPQNPTSPAPLPPGQGAIRRATSNHANPADAVAELAETLGAADLNGLLFFCSPSYDLAAIASALAGHFQCPIAGCTTAGEIFSPRGYLAHSLVGIGLAGPAIAMETHFIPALEDYAERPYPLMDSATLPDRAGNTFALMLIDGLSMLEERVVAAAHSRMPGIPMIGGSAGDGLMFQHAYVFHDGAFHRNAASVTLFTTTLPFQIFHIQHFSETPLKLVVTEADAPSRTVIEINGRPAASEYARIIGIEPEALSPVVFAANPLMLKIGGNYYVRSIQRANPDGSLTFYCAIDNGLVLTLGASRAIVDNLNDRLRQLARDLPDLQLILGCDCILRRLELSQRNEFDAINTLLADYPFVGFSTYGEQYGGLHVNQTLTGVAIGGSP